MTGAVCPSCGVAVVPGYVRCPKCHKPLPRSASNVVGGTALVSDRGKLPVVAVIAAVVVLIAALVYLAVRKPRRVAQQAATPTETEPVSTAPEPAQAPDQVETPAQPTGPSALDVAADLERKLKKQRLWSTVSIIGDHVDVRSGSCSEPAMATMLEGVEASFKAAGLTRIRCLEQSGRVVTAREL